MNFIPQINRTVDLLLRDANKVPNALDTHMMFCKVLSDHFPDEHHLDPDTRIIEPEVYAEYIQKKDVIIAEVHKRHHYIIITACRYGRNHNLEWDNKEELMTEVFSHWMDTDHPSEDFIMATLALLDEQEEVNE